MRRTSFAALLAGAAVAIMPTVAHAAPVVTQHIEQCFPGDPFTQCLDSHVALRQTNNPDGSSSLFYTQHVRVTNTWPDGRSTEEKIVQQFRGTFSATDTEQTVHTRIITKTGPRCSSVTHLKEMDGRVIIDSVRVNCDF